MPTREDFEKLRDSWVELHKKTDESEHETRVRFWKAHPEAKEASRSASSASSAEPFELTIGEQVTKALDRRARDWHAQGIFFDKSLPELRGRLRKLIPGLAELERDTRLASVAKSDIRKSDEYAEAREFLDRWS